MTNNYLLDETDFDSEYPYLLSPDLLKVWEDPDTSLLIQLERFMYETPNILSTLDLCADDPATVYFSEVYTSLKFMLANPIVRDALENKQFTTTNNLTVATSTEHDDAVASGVHVLLKFQQKSGVLIEEEKTVIRPYTTFSIISVAFDAEKRVLRIELCETSYDKERAIKKFNALFNHAASIAAAGPILRRQKSEPERRVHPALTQNI